MIHKSVVDLSKFSRLRLVHLRKIMNMHHKFDSVKSIIDELYDEVSHIDTSRDCLHEKLIAKNEGQSMGRRRHETYALYPEG